MTTGFSWLGLVSVDFLLALCDEADVVCTLEDAFFLVLTGAALTRGLGDVTDVEAFL